MICRAVFVNADCGESIKTRIKLVRSGFSFVAACGHDDHEADFSPAARSVSVLLSGQRGSGGRRYSSKQERSNQP